MPNPRVPYEPVPLEESIAGGPEFGKGYAEGSYLANAASAGLPGIVAAVVLWPFAYAGKRLVRLVRHRRDHARATQSH